MNISFDLIYGNEKIKNIISSKVESKTLPHAIILEGAKGSGKATFAKCIAAALACIGENKPCYKCINCRKIFDGISPDIVFTEPQKDKVSIGIEAIRNIRYDAYVIPNDLEFKMYIIKDSESMTPQAQNALLKVLEEPPKNVYFILLCENSIKLLPTVRSRAQILKMQKFTDEEISEYLIKYDKKLGLLYNKDRETFEFIVKSSEGAIGKALSLSSKTNQNQSEKLYNDIREIISKLTGERKSDFLLAISLFPQKRDDYNKYLNTLLSAFRDVMNIKKCSGCSDLMFFINVREANETAATFTEGTLNRLVSLLENVIKSNEANVNIVTSQTKLLCDMWSFTHNYK